MSEEENADLTDAFLPKSDQLNSDDLIGAPKTITITKVLKKKTGDRKVWIHYEGDNGKPWKPCSGMGRILKEAWGTDGKTYKGRQVTLFRNPKVKWSGEEVGGIQISHMSHIPNNLVTMLTVSDKKKTQYIVAKIQPKAEPEPTPTKTPGDITKAVAAIKNCTPETVDATKAALWKLHTWTDPEVQDLKRAVDEVKSTTKEVSNQ